MKMRRIAFLMVAAMLLGCGSSTTSVQCSDVPVVQVEPDQVVIQVRDTLTISAHFGPICPGAPGQRAGVFFWQSRDKSVVTVDSLTGKLHGINPGQAAVVATDTLDRSLTGTALVLVTTRQGGG
ncbi:MAG TPA: Ig-like domain-containing protein [Gemmatimonadaceae bacterium]|nr:Ig-like domain-containing protein [Gemmatimonadaceae bacterium]